MLRISVSKLGEGSQRLITMTDMTSLSQRRARLKEEVESRDAAVRELEDRRRNIDAYLEALYEIPDLKERQELFDKVQHDSVPFEHLKKGKRLTAFLPDCFENSEGEYRCGGKVYKRYTAGIDNGSSHTGYTVRLSDMTAEMQLDEQLKSRSIELLEL